MEIKCPKCRYKFNEEVADGITEISCVCPRCGMPFHFKREDIQPQAPAHEPSIPIQQDEQIGQDDSKKTPTTMGQDVVKVHSTHAYTADNYLERRHHHSHKHTDKKSLRRKIIIFAALLLIAFVVINKCENGHTNYSEYSDDSKNFSPYTNDDNANDETSEAEKDVKSWLEGSWVLNDDEVRGHTMTFTIRGNYMQITPKDGSQVGGEYKLDLKNNTLKLDKYEFELNRNQGFLTLDGYDFKHSDF